jgi:hypothetical protein
VRILIFAVVIILHVLFTPYLFSQELSNITSVKTITVNGTLGAQLTSYSANGIENRQEPFTWMLNGNLNASVYGINIPISFILTEQQRSYTQPFNQFGLSPTYKWATLHLGYRAMQFSPFTLSGNTLLGAGIELKPKKFRIAAMTGRFLKAVEEDATNYNATPSYKRTGKAVKVGYGTPTDFIDFIYLKAEDDTATLKKKPEQFIVNPSDNTVMGFSGKKSFNKKLFLEADYALSEFNKNLFVDSNSVQRYALKTSAAYQFQNVNLKVQFKRIEPDYKSLGAAYIIADVQEITFAPSFVLMQKKLRIATSIGTQKDNLYNQKFATTNRFIASAIANYTPNQKYGLDINYMNYSIGQESGRINLNDSVKLSQTLNNFAITNRYTLMRTSAIQNFILVISLQKLNDQNRYTEQFTENNTRVVNLSYIFTPTKIPFSFTATLMHTQTEIVSTKIINNGITVGASRSLQSGKINLNSSTSYILSSMDGARNGTILNLIVGSNYRPHKKHSVSANINYLNNAAKATGAVSFSEVRAMLGYEYSF